MIIHRYSLCVAHSCESFTLVSQCSDERLLKRIIRFKGEVMIRNSGDN